LIIDPENFLKRWVSVLEMSIPRMRGLLNFGTKPLARHHSAGAVVSLIHVKPNMLHGLNASHSGFQGQNVPYVPNGRPFIEGIEAPARGNSA
jgi:hypothetical protein